MGNNLKTAAVINMGCKVNSYESQGMTELLCGAGYTLVSSKEHADVFIVNTCTVTQIAARKSRQELRSLRRDNPSSLIVATGCYVEQMATGEEDTLLKRVQSPQAEELLRDGTVNVIVPNRRKKDLLSIMDSYLRERDALVSLSLSSCVEPELRITEQEEHTRAFLKVQDGCRQFCSYCIIPYVRGPLVSKPLADAVEEAKGLARNGYSEIVLTGIHLSSYGLKNGFTYEDANRGRSESDFDLANLILAMEEVPGIERVRLGSLEPRVMTEAFLSRIAKATKLCHHFHLSLQSGADNTLKSMNRHYSAEEYADTLVRIRSFFPDAAFTTDVIVGFPGESEQDHKDSLAFVERMEFAQVHVFRYSRREGTVADRLAGQVADCIKKDRSEEMIAVCEAMEKKWLLSHKNKPIEMLPEEEAEGLWFGHSRDYALLAVKADKEGTVKRGVPLSVIPKELKCSEKGFYMESETV